jgi:hypothetical protein
MAKVLWFFSAMLMTTLIYTCCLHETRANDSEAGLAAGGLVLAKNNAIELRSEELFISPEKIIVDYIFFNRTKRDVEITVAFPLPDLALDDEEFPTGDLVDVSGFTSEVNGTAVKTHVEHRVFKAGKEYTDTLRRLGVPLGFQTSNEDLQKLPSSTRAKLLQLGLLNKEGEPRWTLKTKFYWTQKFPAGVPLRIVHRYKPSVGGSAVSFLTSEVGSNNAFIASQLRKYCVEPSLAQTIRREHGVSHSERYIDYILVTGANWSGPIGKFRLVVDKEDPANYISFCGTGVKKIGPTQFEMIKTNFVPKTNLSILILSKHAD